MTKCPSNLFVLRSQSGEGWVLPNGDSFCASCEDLVAWAELYRAETTGATFGGYCLYMERLGGSAVDDVPRKYLVKYFDVRQQGTIWK